MDRLKILNNSNDGFYISSQDLKLRGPGDLFGIRQRGDLNFELGDIYTDASILQNASDEADELLSNDPELDSAENERIKCILDKSDENSIDFRTI